MKNIDTRQAYKWQNEGGGSSDYRNYDRTRRKKIRREVEKFSLRVLNIGESYWWFSLDDDAQREVYYQCNIISIEESNKYYVNYYWINKPHWTDFKLFIKDMKKQYPGNISKKRDLVINTILNN